MISVIGGPNWSRYDPIYDLDAYNSEARQLRTLLGVQDEPFITIVETTELTPSGRTCTKEFLGRLANAEFATPPHGEIPETGQYFPEFWRRHDEAYHFGEAVTAHPKTVEWVIRLAEIGLEDDKKGNWQKADSYADSLDGILGVGNLHSLTMMVGNLVKVQKFIEEDTGLTVEEVQAINKEFEQPHRKNVIERLNSLTSRYY